MLLRQGLQYGGVLEEQDHCIADDGLALEPATAEVGHGDLLVIVGYATEFVLRRLLLRQA